MQNTSTAMQLTQIFTSLFSQLPFAFIHSKNK